MRCPYSHRRSVANSEKKKYHRRGMDFSRVHRSGVSAILRKGESVSCSPTIKRVRLEEVWRWDGNGTIYLRASPLDEHLADLGVALDSRNPQQVKGAGLGHVFRDEPEVARC